jgi:hypothetical protein
LWVVSGFPATRLRSESAIVKYMVGAMVGGCVALLYCRTLAQRTGRGGERVFGQEDMGQGGMSEDRSGTRGASGEGSIGFAEQQGHPFSRRQGIRRAQELVQSAIPPGRSLSEELIAERRLEAERD